MDSVICQPMVPVISAASGKWILPKHLSPMLKPGGHGAIWKLMLDKGVFKWLDGLDRQAALVRQIRLEPRTVRLLQIMGFNDTVIGNGFRNFLNVTQSFRS